MQEAYYKLFSMHSAENDVLCDSGNCIVMFSEHFICAMIVTLYYTCQYLRVQVRQTLIRIRHARCKIAADFASINRLVIADHNKKA